MGDRPWFSRATRESERWFERVKQAALQLDEEVRRQLSNRGTLPKTAHAPLRKLLRQFKQCFSIDTLDLPKNEATWVSGILQRFLTPIFEVENTIAGRSTIKRPGLFSRIARSVQGPLLQFGLIRPAPTVEEASEVLRNLSNLIEILEDYEAWGAVRRSERKRVDNPWLADLIDTLETLEEKLTALGFGFDSPWLGCSFQYSPHRELRDIGEAVRTIPCRRARNTWVSSDSNGLISVLNTIDQLKLAHKVLSRAIKRQIERPSAQDASPTPRNVVRGVPPSKVDLVLWDQVRAEFHVDGSHLKTLTDDDLSEILWLRLLELVFAGGSLPPPDHSQAIHKWVQEYAETHGHPPQPSEAKEYESTLRPTVDAWRKRNQRLSKELVTRLNLSSAAVKATSKKRTLTFRSVTSKFTNDPNAPN